MAFLLKNKKNDYARLRDATLRETTTEQLWKKSSRLSAVLEDTKVLSREAEVNSRQASSKPRLLESSQFKKYTSTAGLQIYHLQPLEQNPWWFDEFINCTHVVHITKFNISMERH